VSTSLDELTTRRIGPRLVRLGVAVIETLDLRRADQEWFDLGGLPVPLPGAEGPQHERS